MSAPQGDYDMDTILSQRRRGLVLGSLGALALVGCGRPTSTGTQSTYLQFGGSTMGSTYTVKLNAVGQDATTLRTLVQSTLEEIDWRMSLFREDSELSAFNRAGAGVPIAMTDDFLDRTCGRSRHKPLVRWCVRCHRRAARRNLGLWHAQDSQRACIRGSGRPAASGRLAQSCNR